MSQVRAETAASSQRQNEEEEVLETRECDDHEEEISEHEDENKDDSDNEDKSDEGEENDDQDQEDEQQEEENDPESEEDVVDDSDEEKNGENDNNIDTGNVPSYSQKLKNALIGDLDGEFPGNVKVVRIFTSSTFTGKYFTVTNSSNAAIYSVGQM